MTNNQNDDSNSSLEPEVQRASDGPISQDKKGLLGDVSIKTRWIIAFLIGVLLAVAYVTSSLRSPQTSTKSNLYELDPSQVEKRQVLPDYVFTDSNEKTYKLSDFHGQVLILSFWASWCSPCLVELPTFSQMKKKLKNQGLQILAVNVEDTDIGKKFAEDFWARNKFDFMSFFDPKKELASHFQVDLLPSNFVIDKSGRLAFSGFGSTDWSSTQIVELIDGLLQETPQDIPNRPAAPNKAASQPEVRKQDTKDGDNEAEEEDVD